MIFCERRDKKEKQGVIERERKFFFSVQKDVNLGARATLDKTSEFSGVVEGCRGRSKHTIERVSVALFSLFLRHGLYVRSGNL